MGIDVIALVLVPLMDTVVMSVKPQPYTRFHINIC